MPSDSTLCIKNYRNNLLRPEQKIPFFLGVVGIGDKFMILYANTLTIPLRGERIMEFLFRQYLKKFRFV